MAAGKYIFDESANSYMTTGFDLTGSYPVGYSIVWKGKWDLGLPNYHTLIGGTNSGMYISVQNDVLNLQWAGILGSVWVNDGLEHTFIMSMTISNTCQMYVDGTLVSNQNAQAAMNISAGSILEIGRWKAGQPISSGHISHLYFYDRPLTTQEITDTTTDVNNNPQTNLLLEYKNNKTTNTWTEEIGGNNATNAGGVVFEEDEVEPPSSGKYIFDGSATSYMTTGYDLGLTTTGYSIAWKGKWDLGVGGYQSVFGGGISGMEVSLNNDLLYIRWGSGVTTQGWTNDGLEHTFIWSVENGQGAQIFVDGVLESTTGVIPDASVLTADLFIGSWGAGTQRHQGELTHAYFYSRKLTSGEVAQLTADINNNPSSGNILSYKENKTTSTWTEEVGGNDATNVGGVVYEATLSTSVQITWVDSVDGDVIGHKVYRDDVEIADVGLGVQTYTDDTAEPGTTYKYEVQAYTALTESVEEQLGVNMDNITTVPDVPSNLPYIFDGSATSWFNSDFDLNGVGNNSAVVRAKITGADSTSFCMLGGSASSTRYFFTRNAANSLKIQMSQAATSTITQAWANDGQYHQFAYTYDGATMKMYVDGVEILSGAQSGFTTWTAQNLFYIGIRNNTDEFVGEMTDVQFYSKALSLAEVQQINTDITNTATGLTANFASNKTASEWTDEVSGFVATNQGGVTIGT